MGEPGGGGGGSVSPRFGLPGAQPASNLEMTSQQPGSPGASGPGFSFDNGPGSAGPGAGPGAPGEGGPGSMPGSDTYRSGSASPRAGFGLPGAANDIVDDLHYGNSPRTGAVDGEGGHGTNFSLMSSSSGRPLLKSKGKKSNKHIKTRSDSNPLDNDLMNQSDLMTADERNQMAFEMKQKEQAKRERDEKRRQRRKRVQRCCRCILLSICLSILATVGWYAFQWFLRSLEPDCVGEVTKFYLLDGTLEESLVNPDGTVIPNDIRVPGANYFQIVAYDEEFDPNTVHIMGGSKNASAHWIFDLETYSFYNVSDLPIPIFSYDEGVLMNFQGRSQVFFVNNYNDLVAGLTIFDLRQWSNYMNGTSNATYLYRLNESSATEETRNMESCLVTDGNDRIFKLCEASDNPTCFEIYDISENEWTLGPDQSLSTISGTCAYSHYAQSVFAIGGEVSGLEVKTIERIDAGTLNTWVSVDVRLKLAVDRAMTWVVGETIYIIGGGPLSRETWQSYCIDEEEIQSDAKLAMAGDWMRVLYAQNRIWLFSHFSTTLDESVTDRSIFQVSNLIDQEDVP